ncbi:MAG: hypothetical protein H0T46_24990 [Deltaproteobacteria bacterium]|nr:hypothetical protein [Deltaproteobacteria bacterium]
MKKLALGALIAGFAACGGGSGSTKPILVDSAAGDSSGPQVCSPLTQMGCNTGEKCNWIYDQLMPTVVGHIGCEPVGTAAIGAACGNRAVGPDMCVKGAECVSGECKAICDHQGGDPKCDADHACVRYQNLFTDGTTTVAGVCDPGCDPLTQDLKIGTNKTACGSMMPTMPDKGCYGYGEYSCSGVAPTVSNAVAVTLTDRVAPAGDYLNACAPGFMPLLIAETGVMTGLCNGLCAALEADSTKPTTVEIGDATALAKNPTGAAPAAGNATCETGKRGSAADGPQTCRFLWIYNVDDAGMLEITDYTDKMGVCFSRQKYRYDSNNDGMLNAMDATTPRCSPGPAGSGIAGLPPRSAATAGKYDDAADFFCQKVANSMFSDKPLTKGDKVYVGELAGMESGRVYNPNEGPVPARRHVFTNN